MKRICPQCAYDLSGLGAKPARCPECGIEDPWDRRAWRRPPSPWLVSLARTAMAACGLLFVSIAMILGGPMDDSAMYRALFVAAASVGGLAGPVAVVSGMALELTTRHRLGAWTTRIGFVTSYFGVGLFIAA